MARDDFNRRTVLKSTGIALAGGALSSGSVLGAARSESEREHLRSVVQRAREIHRETGSPKRHDEYLDGTDVSVQRSVSGPGDVTADDDGPSVSPAAVSGVSSTLNVYSSGGSASAYYNVDIASQFGGGGSPKDKVGITWPNSDYELLQNGTGKNNAANATLRDSGFGGAVWDFADGVACGLTCNLSFQLSTEMDVITNDTPRKVEGTYKSVSGSCSSAGVSFNVGGGFTVSGSSSSCDIDVKQLDRNVTSDY
ncbi:hypothetical protein [Halomarina oriensis]|uniref:Uncharacterized protein n=1 Tax=Halomarina oriensis TaxID=671145 RepID=A0A6B0GGC4_9EURY|nr:hypothetical protein [Halomarina oriensis]MWG33560.1 hypothetical protein [Halomarina oriensis]